MNSAAASKLNTQDHQNTKQTPKTHTLVSRTVEFPFEDVPKHWQGGVFATRMFDAMQLAFPDGERMFIQSVRNYINEIDNPELKEQVKHFIFQEGQHGKSHTEFTDHLTSQGLKVQPSVKQIKKLLQLFQDKTPKKFQLAATVAAEHLTATLGEHMFDEYDNLLKDAHPTMRAFYLWHGVEEVEHKAVAWDVYENVAGGGYFTRATAMALLYPLAIAPLTVGTMAMMYVDGELNTKEVKKGMSMMFGRKGLWSNTFPKVMKFYKPNFHPWETGYPKRFHKWKEVYSKTNDPIAAADAIS